MIFAFHSQKTIIFRFWYFWFIKQKFSFQLKILIKMYIFLTNHLQRLSKAQIILFGDRIFWKGEIKFQITIKLLFAKFKGTYFSFMFFKKIFATMAFLQVKNYFLEKENSRRLFSWDLKKLCNLIFLWEHKSCHWIHGKYHCEICTNIEPGKIKTSRKVWYSLWLRIGGTIN